jgi:hypothetical protein
MNSLSLAPLLLTPSVWNVPSPAAMAMDGEGGALEEEGKLGGRWGRHTDARSWVRWRGRATGR